MIVNKFPPCFGDKETVFPMNDKIGLREVPDSCMYCYCKTECMKTAVNKKDDISIKEMIVNREYISGSINFFQRWSKLKILKQIKKD